LGAERIELIFDRQLFGEQLFALAVDLLHDARGVGERDIGAVLGIGDARFGVDQLGLGIRRSIILLGERCAQLGRSRGGIGMALVGGFDLADQRTVLVFEELAALALGFELLQQQVHVGVVVAAQRLAVDVDRARGLGAQRLAGGLELADLVG